MAYIVTARLFCPSCHGTRDFVRPHQLFQSESDPTDRVSRSECVACGYTFGYRLDETGEEQVVPVLSPRVIEAGIHAAEEQRRPSIVPSADRDVWTPGAMASHRARVRKTRGVGA